MSIVNKNPWVFGDHDKRHVGVEIAEKMTVTEAIKKGGLDWLVDLRDPITNDQDRVEADEWKQVVKIADVAQEDGKLVRQFHTLGMVKGRYTLLQNRDAFTFFDRAIEEGAAIIQAVGHLDHGRVVWAIAERPETMELLPGDTIHEHLVLLTAHDGSHAVKVMFIPFRTSTGTMLGAGVKEGRRMLTEARVRHTKSIDVRMADLHNVLSAGTGYFDRWRMALVGGTKEDGEEVVGFKNKIITADQIDRVVNKLFPDQKKVDEDGKVFWKASTKATNARNAIKERIDEQTRRAQAAYAAAGQEPPKGVTQLDVFLGIAEYIDKDRNTKNEGNNWVASTFGTGANMRQRAFDMLCTTK